MHDREQCARAGDGRAGARWRRRLLYRTDAAELDLEVSRSKRAGRLRVLGQVMAGEPGSSGTRVAIEGPAGHLEAEADELGQFAFDGLLAGDHRLALDLPHQLVVTPWAPFRPRFPFDHDDLTTALELTIPD